MKTVDGQPMTGRLPIEQFRLGINYWPISSAMRWWKRFDIDEVERDFRLIREARFDSVRIFLLWEDFQPAPDRVSEKSLQRLVAVADIADRNSLSLIVTLFTGHMSGVNWIPRWAIETRGSAVPQRFWVVSDDTVVNAELKNWYHDPEIREAQALLAHEVASAICDHPALWAYDLGNENSNCVMPDSRDAGIVWLETMATAIGSVDPQHPITIGLHMEDLEQDRRLGPAEAARVCDFLCMHGYPMYAQWARSNTDEMLLPFLGLITQWLGGREVLFEEFGAPAVRSGLLKHGSKDTQVKLLDEDEAAAFTGRAIKLIRRFGSTGAMVWCFGDYATNLWSEPPLDRVVHERYFGVWRADRSAKSVIEELKSSIECSRMRPPDAAEWIDVRPDQFYGDPFGNLTRLYRRFYDRYALTAPAIPTDRIVG
jgi:endo-1,4-beta-mannosidase